MTFLHMLSLLAIGALGGLLGAGIVLFIRKLCTKRKYMKEEFINGMRYAYETAAWWLDDHCHIGFDCTELPKFTSRAEMLEAFENFADENIREQEDEN